MNSASAFGGGGGWAMKKKEATWLDDWAKFTDRLNTSSVIDCCWMELSERKMFIV